VYENKLNLKIKIYRTIILPVILYGCEAWSLTVREERRLKVSENRVLRRVFGPKRDEVTGEWRKLHNEEPNDLYSLPNIVGKLVHLVGFIINKFLHTIYNSAFPSDTLFLVGIYD
jgi:hypothetical protein